jgi:hypothetical protein
VRARVSLDEEIRTYPTPIPRCDAQFNFVYEQRARLSQWLNQLDAALDGGQPGGFRGRLPHRERAADRHEHRREGAAQSPCRERDQGTRRLTRWPAAH